MKPILSVSLLHYAAFKYSFQITDADTFFTTLYFKTQHFTMTHIFVCVFSTQVEKYTRSGPKVCHWNNKTIWGLYTKNVVLCPIVKYSELNSWGFSLMRKKSYRKFIDVFIICTQDGYHNNSYNHIYLKQQQRFLRYQYQEYLYFILSNAKIIENIFLFLWQKQTNEDKHKLSIYFAHVKANKRIKR